MIDYFGPVGYGNVLMATVCLHLIHLVPASGRFLATHAAAVSTGGARFGHVRLRWLTWGLSTSYGFTPQRKGHFNVDVINFTGI